MAIESRLCTDLARLLTSLVGAVLLVVVLVALAGVVTTFFLARHQHVRSYGCSGIPLVLVHGTPAPLPAQCRRQP